MLQSGLGFGQIHWTIKCPIPNTPMKQLSTGKMVVTAFRKFWGHPLPAKWNNSDCQHYCVLLSSVCEDDMLKTGQVQRETDWLILPGIMQLPKIRTIRHGLGIASVSFWHSRLSLRQMLVFPTTGAINRKSEVGTKPPITQEGRSFWRIVRISAVEFTKFPWCAVLGWK
jgi:hypothetical protein